MADLFGRQDQVLRGGLSSDAMFVSWPALQAVDGGVGLLIQRIGLEYRQPVRRIWELGPGLLPTNAGYRPLTPMEAGICSAFPQTAGCNVRAAPTYYIIGRPEGRLQMQRLVGPNVLAVAFYSAYGSPCGEGVMTISGAAGCSATGNSDQPVRPMTWRINGVLLDSVSADMTAQEMIIQESLSAMFAGLNITTGAPPAVNNELVN